MAELQKLEFTHFSPSSLDTILTCPRRFYYYKIEESAVRIAGKGMNFGSVVHEAIDDYYSKYQNTITDAQEIKDKLYQEINVRWNDYDLRNMEKRRDKCIDDFSSYELIRLKDKNNRSSKVITELDLKKDGRRSIIDMYNNGVAVDWKTGTFQKFDRKMLVQGKYEELLLQQHGYEVKHTLFVVLGSKKFLPLPYIGIDVLEKYENEGKQIIEEGEFPKKPGWYCNGCDYQLHCFFEEDNCLWCDI